MTREMEDLLAWILLVQPNTTGEIIAAIKSGKYKECPKVIHTRSMPIDDIVWLSTRLWQKTEK